MLPPFSTLNWSLDRPTPPQELQIKTFTSAQYSKAKARDKRLATALRKKTVTSLQERHCHCCTWKTRAELETVMLGAAKVAESGTSIQERATDPADGARQAMQGGILLREAESTSADRLPSQNSVQRETGTTPASQDLTAGSANARIGKDISKSALDSSRKPHRQVKRLTIKIKPLSPTKPKRARTAAIPCGARGRAREPDVQIPMKTSSRGRTQRPLKRHKNDLY